MAQTYIERYADSLLQDTLASSGAVWIRGPKWCGKTRTASMQAKSILLMQDPDQTQNYLQIAGVKPSILLEGAVPRLIDEWQMAPIIWDAVRHTVDIRGEMGQFILTGSTLPLDSETMHSGTGRISKMLMRTMSLYESGESNGQVSLESLFNGEAVEGSAKLDIIEVAFVLCRGGWPASIGVEHKIALKQATNYYEAIVDNDISEIDGISKDPIRVRKLLTSLARNTGTTATLVTIQNDVNGAEQRPAANTISTYLDGLERLFVIEDQPAWNPELRSKSRLRKAAKRHFVDPSIAVAAMKTNPDGLLKDMKTFGCLFESLCVRDLRIYTQMLSGDIFHYRDNTDLEADAIIALHDGRWAAVEMKMGHKEIDKAAENLLKLRDKINTEKMKMPSFLLIITGDGYAYQRKDGVYCIPISCLKA